MESNIKTSRHPLPMYEVEFVPLERRLLDRRKRPVSGYTGIERRRRHSRRDTELVSH